MKCPNCGDGKTLRRLDELLAEGLVLREDVLPDGDVANKDRVFLYCDAKDRGLAPDGRPITNFGLTPRDGIAVLKPARGEGCWISSGCMICNDTRIVNEPGHPKYHSWMEDDSR